MKKYYIDQKVILRKNLKLGSIVRTITNKTYLVSYYEDNIFKYDVISEIDIIDEDEYEIIRNRVNLINKLLDP